MHPNQSNTGGCATAVCCAALCGGSGVDGYDGSSRHERHEQAVPACRNGRNSPMTGWIALSDQPAAPNVRHSTSQALFVCEVTLPIETATVLLDWGHDTAAQRSFSLLLEPAAGLVLMGRDGAALHRHVLRGPLPMAGTIARITYRWNAATDQWALSYGRIGFGDEVLSTGRSPTLPSSAELAALCHTDGPARRHPALLWFGVTEGDAPPQRAPWIGLRTPIDTLRGPVAAGLLRPGDLVRTIDSGFQPVLRATRLTLPSRGSFAPVVLRAPFLGQRCDMLMSADQLITLTGAEVEYMFGLDEVLVPVAALANGTLARHDGLHASTEGVAIDLGLPELMIADGIEILSHGAALEPSRRMLQRFEAQQLMAMLERRNIYGAA